MLWKNRNKRVGPCMMVVTSCLAIAVMWGVLVATETAQAKKPPKPPEDEPTRYGVMMNGDLTIVGAFNLDPGQDPPPDWGGSFETGIRVNSPRPKICFANAFLDTGGVTLDGESCDCGAGVIPDGDGRPNWGALTVEGDATNVVVKYRIGETDAVTGKIRRYTLISIDAFPVNTTSSGTWPNGEGDDITVHEVIIPIGTQWNLVQDKPGNLDETLISTQDTVITFTEFSE